VESVEAPKESGSIIEQNQPERPMFHNEAGYLLRSKELGFKAETKVDGQQLGNRLKNKLTPGEYMALQEQGLGEFLKEKRSPEEVAKWVDENGPRVEVKELKPGRKHNNADVEQWLENLGMLVMIRYMALGSIRGSQGLIYTLELRQSQRLYE
jgi:hypothetical protein